MPIQNKDTLAASVTTPPLGSTTLFTDAGLLKTKNDAGVVTLAGTVTAVSVASSNGFTGSSSGGATPALTLATSITGVLKGNGTAISASNVTDDAQVKLSTFTTNGDLIYGTGAGTITRLGVGSNTQVLTLVAGVPVWVTPSSPGTGTVTGVSVTTANGVSGSVATSTTTPAITLTLGNITPTTVSTGDTTVAGNLTFSGTGRRITANMNSATATDRLFFQSNNVNTSSFVSVMPNGTATTSAFLAEAGSDPANNSTVSITATSTIMTINSTRRGTGAFLPLRTSAGNGIQGITQDILGNIVIGGDAALATTATDRFLYLNSMAGLPTGTPTASPLGANGAMLGKTPITVDSSNNLLYFYSGGAWRTSNAGAGTVTSVSVVGANGFTGSSSGGATPALTLATSVTGVLKGNGTAISASNVTDDAQVKLSSFTSPGDLIYGTGAGTITTLSVGSNTQVLTLTGGVPTWAAPVAGAAAAGSLTGTTVAINVVNYTAETIAGSGNTDLAISMPFIGNNVANHNVTVTGGKTNMTTGGPTQAGSVTIQGGLGTSQSNGSGTVTGGNVNISAGNQRDQTESSIGASNGTGGDVVLSAGSGTNGGSIQFKTGSGLTLTERLRILNTGSWSVGSSGTAYGTTGQVLTSAGDAPPAWQTPATNGTVTNVSVTTANGVSGSVATSTTTPAITLTLGAITPSSVDSSGNISVTTAGSGLKIKEGANAKMGIATLTAGTVSVTNTSVTAVSRIFLTIQTPGGTPGAVYVSTRSVGASFDITSTSGPDTSDVAWMIVEPA